MRDDDQLRRAVGVRDCRAHIARTVQMGGGGEDAHLRRLRRSTTSGRHSRNLCGPVDGRGACKASRVCVRARGVRGDVSKRTAQAQQSSRVLFGEVGVHSHLSHALCLACTGRPRHTPTHRAHNPTRGSKNTFGRAREHTSSCIETVRGARGWRARQDVRSGRSACQASSDAGRSAASCASWGLRGAGGGSERHV
jgi:hypothetical protein